MQRVLDPAQIEAFAQRSIPRIRLAESATVFRRRGERLRELSNQHAIGDYLAAMALLCDAQQDALTGSAPDAWPALSIDLQTRIARAREHDLPPLQAPGWPRDAAWRTVLAALCSRLAQRAPAPLQQVCSRLAAADAAQVEAQADCLLSGRTGGLELQSAPLMMAALQVYWVQLVRQLGAGFVSELEAAASGRAHTAMAAVCPVCGSLPVASIVRADAEHQGYRYLHCGLCATEWHLVRIKCSHCLSTEGIRYHYVEHGSEAVRAESCQGCLTYRKILYQEKQPGLEPLTDDLASITLDLLMSDEGYHRASGNPLLWQPSDA